uniref:Uncharacterized protein n=1 Tax=Kalanchoe fedtschenkoi TaxID=63787 RepID=A0A7N0U7Y5_KALFE
MHSSQSSATTLFDEIHRAPSEEMQRTRAEPKKPQRKQSRDSLGKDRKTATEETEDRRRTCLIDDWMEKRRIRTRPAPRLRDGPALFSPSSASSRSPAFSSPDCKHVIKNRKTKTDDYTCCSVSASREAGLKSEPKALKMQAGVKKPKPPISPGSKLASFINSMFNRRRERRGLSLSVDVAAEEYKSPCSSASSSTRSCLVRRSPSDVCKPVKKSVRFYPPSVGRAVEIRSRNVEHSETSISRRRDENLRFSSMEEEFRGASELEGDAASDASSELFEIDHIIFAAINSSSSGGSHVDDELPVFETTNVNIFFNGGIVF